MHICIIEEFKFSPCEIFKRPHVRCLHLLHRVRTISTIHVHLVGERLKQFGQHVRFEFTICIDFTFDFFIFGQSLFHTILGVKLGVLVLINVIEHLKGYIYILDLILQFVDFLQTANKALSKQRKRKVKNSFPLHGSKPLIVNLHFLI